MGVPNVDEEDAGGGFDCHVAAYEPSAEHRCEDTDEEDADTSWQRPGGLVLLRQGQTYTSAPPAPHAWKPATVLGNVGPICGPVVRVSMAAGPRAACPQFFVFGQQGVAATGAGELAWQRM